jgi:hypothetical protein
MRMTQSIRAPIRIYPGKRVNGGLLGDFVIDHDFLGL